MKFLLITFIFSEIQNNIINGDGQGILKLIFCVKVVTKKIKNVTSKKDIQVTVTVCDISQSPKVIS